MYVRRDHSVKLALGGILLAVISSLSVPVVAESAVLEEEGVVKLIATVDDNPAFTNVTWRVYRHNDKQPIETISRHTATINLRPGAYKVVVVMNDRERSRSFQLKSKNMQEIVISMD